MENRIEQTIPPYIYSNTCSVSATPKSLHIYTKVKVQYFTSITIIMLVTITLVILVFISEAHANQVCKSTGNCKATCNETKLDISKVLDLP